MKEQAELQVDRKLIYLPSPGRKPPRLHDEKSARRPSFPRCPPCQIYLRCNPFPAAPDFLSGKLLVIPRVLALLDRCKAGSAARPLVFYATLLHRAAERVLGEDAGA